jgi:hypothetical protein
MMHIVNRDTVKRAAGGMVSVFSLLDVVTRGGVVDIGLYAEDMLARVITR